MAPSLSKRRLFRREKKLVSKQSKRPAINTNAELQGTIPQVPTAGRRPSNSSDADDMASTSVPSMEQISDVAATSTTNDHHMQDVHVPKETLFPWSPPNELGALIQHNSSVTSQSPLNFRLMIASPSPLFYEDDIIDLKVINQKVTLEYCHHGHNSCLTGVVRVYNMSYHKNVFVRITQDNWKTFEDVKAEYINSQSSTIDRFGFTYTVTKDAIGNDFQFAICYQSSSGEFWDDNGSENYVLQFRYSEYHWDKLVRSLPLKYNERLI